MGDLKVKSVHISNYRQFPSLLWNSKLKNLSVLLLLIAAGQALACNNFEPKDPVTPETCNKEPNCGQCLSNSVCGWCASKDRCIAADPNTDKPCETCDKFILSSAQCSEPAPETNSDESSTPVVSAPEASSDETSAPQSNTDEAASSNEQEEAN